MTRKSLTEQIDSIPWSEEAADAFDKLTACSAADPDGGAIILAAALLLAREHPGGTDAEERALVGLGGEFIELMFVLRNLILEDRPLPHLGIVDDPDV